MKFCNICLDKCLQLSDVPENSKVKTGLPEEGADEGRNASEHQLNNEIWWMGIGALNVGLVTTDNSARSLLVFCRSATYSSHTLKTEAEISSETQVTN
jgi:hypothetical protein